MPPSRAPTMLRTETNCLLAGLNCRDNIHLIIGTNPLAAARCIQSINAGAQPVLVAAETSELYYGLRSKIDEGAVRWVKKHFEDEDVLELGREDVGGVVDAVFVTSGPRDVLGIHISQLCKRNRILVNVVDAPHLCTLALLSTHTDGPLQIGVTTNNNGCKLASRIRREVASSLPPNLGSSCARLGEMRRHVLNDEASQSILGDLDDSLGQGSLFNRLVREGDGRGRRQRWLSQVCEYWPLKTLAAIADSDIEKLLTTCPSIRDADLQHEPNGNRKQKPGRIILAGSGPGHPSLLTHATHNAIQTADLILADKLIPSKILDLVPRRTPVQIARKFPGNADAAQQELQDTALEGVRAGKTILRLKQGDPFVYGRGGEEVDVFRRAGLAHCVVVLPGITSALSAPLFAAIPPTQRGVADQILICTGTGKKGKCPTPPEFVPTRTTIFLMSLHRIGDLVRGLTTRFDVPQSSSGPSAALPGADNTKRILWPVATPCAVIERASCPDQRVIRTTLEHVAKAIEAEGSRPPGLLVVGAACEALYSPKQGRVWAVEEGFRGLDMTGGDHLGEAIAI